ncbi:MAG TPA: HD domain-containing protein [Caulobacteraceae bacterium]|jgi:gamma-butyrobetaine dioxygenase|nr:HD domain-containing protein [Caulobacteraceae bacterium]
MTPPSRLEDIERLYAARGGLTYGEGVTQLEHALQCAVLAQAAGASPSLVAAALLHDIGHLLQHEREATAFSADDHHEAAGAEALAGLFGEPVWRPVALHVAAKRYLCFAEPDYFAALSPASQASLKLQGGPFDAARAAAFERLPYWREARDLRRFDDTGKRDQPADREFADFLPLLRALLIAA